VSSTTIHRSRFSPLAQSVRVCGFLWLLTLATVSVASEGGVSVRFASGSHEARPSAVVWSGDDESRHSRAWPEAAQMALFGVGLSGVGLGLARRKG
jgi:hypothetical protein